MGEEFVAVIKLVSGEEILASVCVDETGEEPIIIAHTPVTMKMINNGMYVKIKPWMELADDDMFVIRMEDVLTMSESRDLKMIMMHQSFVNRFSRMKNQRDAFGTERNPGYISSVDDARELLEKIFKQKSSEL